MDIKKINKKIFALSLVMSLGLLGYFISETVLAAGQSVDDAVVVTLNVTEGITITQGDDVTMDPLSVSLLESTGSSAWTVKTNATAGYTLAVKADASPALRVLTKTTDFFADYTDAGDVPELWSIASGAKEFGFSAYGDDSLDATWGANDSCGTTNDIGGNKYLGTKTTDQIIATRSTVTPTAGIATTICFAAEQKDVYAASGTYNSTITATATTQ